jgi:hypothetical protein
MGNDGTGAPLSRRVPGAARPGPGQAARPVLPESVLNRMQAAIDAEHANADVRGQGEPNTEPLPRVTVSGSPSKHVASPAASPSGVLPETDVQQDQAAGPERVAKPPRAAKPQRAEQPLRVAKALRVGAELRAAEELRAAAAARVHVAEPEPPSAAEPQAQSAAEPQAQGAAPPEPPAAQPEVPSAAVSVPVRAAEATRPAEPPYPVQPPRAAEPPRVTRYAAAAAYDNEPTPGTIGWLWPEETEPRRGGGGGGPRWQPPRGTGGGGWHHRTAILVAMGSVLLAAAGVIICLSLRSTPATPSSGGQSSPKATAPPTGKPSAHATKPPPPADPNPPGLAASRRQAAAWIARQVAPGTVVACDPQTCPALTAGGISAAQQVRVAMNSQSLSSASIVVVTPELRTLFSTLDPSLGNTVAHEVLARFGEITIQVVWPAGAAAYRAALSQNLEARIQLGGQLLSSGHVSASPTAQDELSAGDVDSRILLALQAVANQQPIHVVGFSDSGPGAAPGIPFRTIYLAETDPSAGMSPPAYLHSLVAALRAYATSHAGTKPMQYTLADGQTVIRIEYAAPSPVGPLP